MKYESKRARFEILRGQLHTERASYIPTWQDVNDFILPASGKFFVSDVNRGGRRDLDIINNTATMAANTCHAGMMSGITSPARPWFRLGAPDPDLNEYSPVKDWCDIVGQRMNNVFLKSNLYKTLPYRDLAGFGTAPFSVEENIDNVIHTAAYPIGSFYIAKDEFGRVNVFMREWMMSIRNIIRMFGRRDANGDYDWSNFSSFVKNAYERGQYETYISIVHVICPNEDYIPGSPFNKQKKFQSCYYERGFNSGGSNRNYMQQADDDKYLRESGFDYFPILSPRWRVSGEDVYANDYPGVVCLGDVKQLQHSEMKFGKALDKMVDPTMVYPTSLQNQHTSQMPGGVIFADLREGMQGVRSAYDVNLRIDQLDAKMQRIEQRISRGFYEDLFLMLANNDRRQITAREIDERHEEKLLALGPVLEQLNQDMLDPLIDIAFNIMLKKGMVPTPPEELQGSPLKIEYISIMQQAQKMIGVNTQERFMNSIIAIAGAKPDVWDKVDTDQYIDTYGDGLSVPRGVIRSDEATAEIRAQQQQQIAQQQAAQNLPGIAGAARDLSQADIGDGQNALSKLVNG